MGKKKLVIIGASSIAEIAYEYFTHDSEYEVCGFSVNKCYLNKDELFNLPIVELEKIETYFSPNEFYAFIAINYQQLNIPRTKIYIETKKKGYRIASYISSKAFVWHNAKIGENCFIFEDNTIQPFVTIGDNNIIWSGNHIGHHTTIGDNNFISSHVVISGSCKIGNNNFFGVNSTFANNLKIGNYNWFSPGVTIIKDVEDKKLFKANKNFPAEISSFEFFKIEEQI